jgi:hypothetical protein
MKPDGAAKDAERTQKNNGNRSVWTKLCVSTNYARADGCENQKLLPGVWFVSGRACRRLFGKSIVDLIYNFSWFERRAECIKLELKKLSFTGNVWRLGLCKNASQL